MNLMLDIETVALDDRATVVQIAIQAFSDDFTFKNEDSINLKIDIVKQILDGRSLDSNVIKWWSKQESKNDVFTCEHSIEYSVSELFNFIDSYDNPTLWANGMLFDVGIVNDFLRQYASYDLYDLIKYNRFYDYRTLRNQAMRKNPNQLRKVEGITSIKYSNHDALDDCRFQIEVLSEIVSIISN